MKAWGQLSKGRSSHPVNSEVATELDIFLAEETARRTRELLVSQGWCLWECSALGCEVIAVASDETVQGVPEGYPVYTVAELEELCQSDVTEAHLRLVHEAKKIAGAKVTTEVTTKIAK